jgi:uncharacterized membrane protein YebE (DUF533 family)
MSEAERSAQQDRMTGTKGPARQERASETEHSTQQGVLDDAEQKASAKGVAEEVEPERQEAGGPAAHDDAIVQVLAAKILSDWLKNRQQLLVPFTIDLQRLDSPEAEVLIHAMVAAAYAGGDPGERATERLNAALDRLNADDAQREAFGQALKAPKPLRDILASVPDVRVGAMVYAASLLAIDRRKLVNRHFMRYLAARLDLAPPLVRSLEQRFRPAA